MAADSPCGDWEPYKDEKCFKVLDKLEHQTYDDATKACHQQENSSSLVSILTLEEQKFFSDFLFKTHKVVDTLWIGAKYSSNKFKWTDDSDLSFTNWAEGSPSNTADKACVQMNPDGSSMGKWVDEPCNKKNLVVCQKTQTWSVSILQNILLDVRKELKNSQQNPVPIGFIYVQLPSQPEPKNLWPMVEWKEVTSDYAGLFFRAEGGKSAAFGEKQSENSPKLIKVTSQKGYDVSGDSTSVVPGTKSHSVYSGASLGNDWSLSFEVSGGEVRPSNMAMRIWKRIN